MLTFVCLVLAAGVWGDRGIADVATYAFLIQGDGTPCSRVQLLVEPLETFVRDAHVPHKRPKAKSTSATP